VDEEELHRLKSLECLTGAESELAAARFNNAANRAYYACFSRRDRCAARCWNPPPHLGALRSAGLVYRRPCHSS